MRGGYLVVDDIWGDEAWDIFRADHGAACCRESRSPTSPSRIP